ncbi:cellulose biosynthesis protein BcsE [Acidovorax sp. 69]|uniref:cellulose biosynthesis protein BcsE n=1 Tax=Acidovorax sp. 69 TaxID=2035202 RepID=UPI000CA81F9F|nr:cellulose biosynthesis protein BcsE [Acidovorax sp. 69]PJI96698.1 cellulose biosynthesis protein BcsE [Acidovorax sp. 69]
MSSASSSQRKAATPAGFLRAITQRLRPSSRQRAASSAPTARIGIEGLPDGVGQLPPHVPVSLVAADDSSAALWFPALLEDAVAAGPVALVASSAAWADALLLHPTLREACRTGRLMLWLLAPGLQAEVQRHGLAPLMDELERTGLRDEHALYMCDAQGLLSGLSVAQLARVSRQLGALCRERLRPVVLGFFPPLEPEVLLPALRNLCQMSMHIATLRTDADRWSLGLERWNTDAGALFQTAFGVLHDAASGRLAADGTRTRGAVRELVEAVDQSDVIATRASVHGQRGVPGHWRIVDSLADVEVAAAASVAATVLIDAGQAADFESRARLVHQLRLSRPLTLKIVVRENLGKLRTHSEQALLQLGASAVVYKEVGFSRLLQLLQDVNAQSHTRKVHPDYEQALDSFMPARERGYQPPAQFCSLVRGMLDRTHNIGLSHSMVRLNVLAQIPHLDALRACHTSRDGDLFTADHEAVYVFLFACREPDVELALNRLFTLPLTQLFASEATDCSEMGIRAMAGHLQESLRKGLPDYSAVIDNHPHPVAVVPTPMARAPAPGMPTLPIDTGAPHPPADPLTMPLLHIAAGPSVQHRPIARRAVPRVSPRSMA